ncbi:hypothetical protein [Actinoalloteichus caeruleus]|uniref:hypothetical protein n=1 Tax=Actinoalloteichus cyanogriseus TaxID=2893586 RepID=UPI003BB8BEBE
MRELIEKYRWADQDEDLVLTLAVTTCGSVDEVVSAYGGSGRGPVLLTHDDAWVPQEDFGSYFHVQVLTEGSRTVMIEPNGWAGNLPGIARRASSRGFFLSVHWSMSGTRRVVEARGGAVVSWFNPFLIAEPGGAGDLVPAWAEDTVFDDEWPNASSFAAVELRTGLAVDRSWFTTPLPTYRIPDPDQLLADDSKARTP